MATVVPLFSTQHRNDHAEPTKVER